MRLVYVIGCCLSLAIVLTPSDAALWWGKETTKPNDDPKPTGDVQVGLVRAKKTMAAPPANPPQKASGDSETNSGIKKTSTATEANPPQKASGDSKTNSGIKKTSTATQANPPQKAPGDVGTEAGTKPGSPPVMKVNKEIMTNPNSQAVVAAGASAMAAAQHQIEKNQEKSKKLETKLEKLDKEMKTDSNDESLSDLTQALLDVAKRRVKIKAALIVYGIVNMILYIAQFAGSIITPPIGKAIYVLDLLAKRVVSKPLDDYYADFQKAQAEAVAQYVDKHKEEFKNAKVGKKVLVRTNSGKQSYILLKKKPGDPVNPKFLTVADKNAMEVVRIAAQFR